MSEHDELEAMKKIADALEPLDEAARQRALYWANSRFRTTRTGNADGGSTSAQQFGTTSESSDNTVRFESFAELFEAANPNTEKEKALIASYWEQACQNLPSFASQSLNAGLKDLGHGIGNITEALTALKNDRPALILQLKKSGTSRQARKTYKLTQEGMRKVQTMIRTGNTVTEAK